MSHSQKPPSRGSKKSSANRSAEASNSRSLSPQPCKCNPNSNSSNHRNARSGAASSSSPNYSSRSTACSSSRSSSHSISSNSRRTFSSRCLTRCSSSSNHLSCMDLSSIRHHTITMRTSMPSRRSRPRRNSWATAEDKLDRTCLLRSPQWSLHHISSSLGASLHLIK